MGKQEAKGKFAADIQEQMEEIKSSEDWRERFMDLEEMMEYVANTARQEGRQEGLEMVILNLYNTGTSISQISFVVQESEEEVRRVLTKISNVGTFQS